MKPSIEFEEVFRERARAGVLERVLVYSPAGYEQPTIGEEMLVMAHTRALWCEGEGFLLVERTIETSQDFDIVELEPLDFLAVEKCHARSKAIRIAVARGDEWTETVKKRLALVKSVGASRVGVVVFNERGERLDQAAIAGKSVTHQIVHELGDEDEVLVPEVPEEIGLAVAVDEDSHAAG
jgi:hypothetical protein